jgi:DNA invertase Pin-like site-specific DNA recombinase
MRQVLENKESTQRQYQLRERALALGWRSEQIRVIDCDQGRSGASEAGRDGFQQLVAEVSLGNAGIVMGLEVSRLARNNTDWHRLLQLCAFTDSLILDQDGLYDPSSFNDRLLLGLKGAMSEAELHVLKSRLQEGILNKARRGELKTALPVGLVYDEADRVVLTPDTQVREVLDRFFKAFRRLGAAFAVVREFRRDGIQMPHYSRIGPRSSRVTWGDLSNSQALRILHNPRYAGAFAYGRSRSRRGPDGMVRSRKQAQDQWVSLVPDAHEGYISWEDYQDNQRKLAENAKAYGSEIRTPPREGPALLQGLAICGVCGKRMTVRYHQRRGRLVPDYVCQRDKVEHGRTNDCQRMPGGQIDSAVAQLLAGMVNEKNVDVAIAVQAEVQERLEAADRLRQQQVERCRYEADLARRRYLKVDPEKRFVAGVLEAEWNERLRDLDEAQAACEQARQRDKSTLEGTQLEQLRNLAGDFADVWKTGTLADRDRKRIVRLLVEDATLIYGDSARVHFRFKGGACKTLTLPKPLSAVKMRKTSAEVVREIDRLLDEQPEHAIASILNERGFKTGTGQSFSRYLVGRIRIAYSLPTRHARLRRQNKLTANELAAKLRVSSDKIRRCRKLGLLTAYEYKEGHHLYDDVNSDITTTIPQLKSYAHIVTSRTTNEAQYAT